MARQTDTDAAEAIEEHIDVDHLADRLEGRNGGLRTSKPTASQDDGLTQFVWRMARFSSGADTSMPTTATWWLQDYLDEEGIDASVSGISDDAGTEIIRRIWSAVDEVLEILGEPTGQAARRYKKAGVIA